MSGRRDLLSVFVGLLAMADIFIVFSKEKKISVSGSWKMETPGLEECGLRSNFSG